MTLKSLMSRICATGIKQVTNFGKKMIPALKSPYGYLPGMVFTIPKDYKVFQDAHGENFILVRLNNEDDWKIFYPSTFWKKRYEVDESGNLTGNIFCSEGEVVDFIQGFVFLQEAIDHLVDRPLKITDVRYVLVKDPQTNHMHYTSVPTIDFCK